MECVTSHLGLLPRCLPHLNAFLFLQILYYCLELVLSSVEAKLKGGGV